MIAAVKGWHALLAAFLFHMAPDARAADDANGAARELARKTVALVGADQAVTVVWRNLSSLGPAGMAEVRGAFEAALQQAGSRADGASPAEIRITVSESQSQFLLVEEAHKAEEHPVWIVGWNRGAASGRLAGVGIERKLVWEQEEPILDVVFPSDAMLVLSPARVALYARQNGAWQPRGSANLTPAQPWPRDLRGHLRVNGSAFQAFLPGMVCGGTVAPSLSMDCRPGDDPWVLESGSRAMVVGNFAATRDYFDGRMTSQNGQSRTVAPFYSAASVEEQGRMLWLLATLDGHTRLFDAEIDSACGTADSPCGGWTGWGSDIAGIEARCSNGGQILATRPSDGNESDSLQAFAIRDRLPEPLTRPMEFAGPVTALWSLRGESALAVERDTAAGRYRAYVVTLVCGS